MDKKEKRQAKAQEINDIRTYIKSRIGDKKFGNLATKDKDLILESLAKMFGLINSEVE